MRTSHLSLLAGTAVALSSLGPVVHPDLTGGSRPGGAGFEVAPVYDVDDPVFQESPSAVIGLLGALDAPRWSGSVIGRSVELPPLASSTPPRTEIDVAS